LRAYRPAYKLAQLFLTNTPPDVSGGGVQGFSLFFEMNNLFEEYVGRIARRIFRQAGFQVVLQGPQRHLAIDERSGLNAFAMKPDVVGLNDRLVVWIMDTKWKELSREEAKEGVAQSDLYQMYAYANCYACSDVVLVYPHHAGMGSVAGVRASYKLKSWAGGQEQEGEARIKVATLDLSDLKSVPKQLSAIFQREIAENVAKPEVEKA
jgi:5-methylcytosine-specific restriction enzyme subunit McrC